MTNNNRKYTAKDIILLGTLNLFDCGRFDAFIDVIDDILRNSEFGFITANEAFSKIMDAIAKATDAVFKNLNADILLYAQSILNAIAFKMIQNPRMKADELKTIVRAEIMNYISYSE